MPTRMMIVVFACSLALLAAHAGTYRLPIAAGDWYPEDAAILRAAVEQYVNQAQVPEVAGRVAACIAPCSAYSYCGAIAGHAFKPLQRGQYKRVIVLTGSHTAFFKGCSIPEVDYYVTPLGQVPLDMPAVRRICVCEYIDTRAVVYDPKVNATSGRLLVHEIEHGIEVLLPFLQVQLGEFELVPIVVGNVRDEKGRLHPGVTKSIGTTLKEIVDDETLVVVSTNLTRYGKEFHYTPFKQDVASGIEWLDKRAIELVLGRDIRGYLNYLDKSHNTICGAAPLAIMMCLLPQETEGQLLAYDTSGRAAGDMEGSVSYAAMLFSEPKPKPVETDGWSE